MAANKADNDMNAHVQDYSLFTGILKWGTILALLAAAIVVLIIAN